MLSKAFLIFIWLILIFEIVISTQWTTIEMEHFKSKNKQNIQLKNLSSSTHFGNTNVIKIQSRFELDKFLIYISSDKFKYCILPYLSSQDFVKIYLHFQNVISELNFHKFLPPSRFYITNKVFDVQEPTTLLQPLEINLLYQFNGEYSSLEQYILYSIKSKMPIIVEPHDVSIHSNSICALLSQNKIIPYIVYTIPNSNQELLILIDHKGDQFFVTFEKSKGQFINIAKGFSGVLLKEEFSNYVECIWEAYNLQGWKKNYWKLKSFLTMIYVKYIFYVVKMFAFLVYYLAYPFEIFSEFLENQTKHNLCVESFLTALFLVFYVPYVLMICPSGYILCILWYYTTLLPFFVLAFPLKHFLFGFNLYSFWFVSQTLAFFYVCFFPHIKTCVPISMGEKESQPGKNILKSFEIKPKKIMSVVPLLIQKRKMFSVECADTFIFCLINFALSLFLSIPFWAGDTYF